MVATVSQTSIGFWWPLQLLRVLVRHFVECPIIEICLVSFSGLYYEYWGFRENQRLSSHDIRARKIYMTYCWCWPSSNGWGCACWVSPCTSQPLFFILYSLEGSHYALAHTDWLLDWHMALYILLLGYIQYHFIFLLKALQLWSLEMIQLILCLFDILPSLCFWFFSTSSLFGTIRNSRLVFVFLFILWNQVFLQEVLIRCVREWE